MPRDSTATRSRLIEAAVEEFSRHGLAGARVDRIATSASANKRAIYDYFGNKEGLFDAALTHVVSDLVVAVPLDEHDLPGYAGTLFDYLLAHPEAVRMNSWRRLERPQAGPTIEDTFVGHMALVRDHSTTAIDGRGIGPTDLVILVIGLANAWHLSAADLLAAGGVAPTDAVVAAHRAAVVEAARRVSNAR